MDTPVLSSTLLLTLLLLVGLFFFIRASVKDRTQTVQFVADVSEDSLRDQLRQHFTQRAYQVTSGDGSSHQVTFSGYVRPSGFLAIFLSLLAAIGLLCLALVIGFLFPNQAALFLGLPLLSPLAGWFYWKGAGRTESVSFTVQPVSQNGPSGLSPDGSKSVLKLVAHRDEILALQRSLPLKEWEVEST